MSLVLILMLKYKSGGKTDLLFLIFKTNTAPQGRPIVDLGWS